MNRKFCPYCNADIKISKNGNEYCSNICWEKEPYKTQRLQDQLQGEIIVETEHGDWGAR